MRRWWPAINQTWDFIPRTLHDRHSSRRWRVREVWRTGEKGREKGSRRQRQAVVSHPTSQRRTSLPSWTGRPGTLATLPLGRSPRVTLMRAAVALTRMSCSTTPVVETTPEHRISTTTIQYELHVHVHVQCTSIIDTYTVYTYVYT